MYLWRQHISWFKGYKPKMSYSSSAVTSQYMTQLLAPLHFHIQYLAVSSFCYAKCYARNHATRHHTIQPSITITQYYDTDQTSVIKDDYA